MNKREIKWLEHAKLLYTFDLTFRTEYGQVAGMDEVGRGPLAGNVVAATVILPQTPMLPRVDDSKKLSEKARIEIDAQIREIALFIGIGEASPDEIDRFNILQATKLAMKRAVKGANPDCMLVDAVKKLGLDYPTFDLIKGDTKSASIAAASIVAKVWRDKQIASFDIQYPEYGFAKNKGYGTAQHIEAIKKYGATDIHRKTFIKKFV